MATPVDEPDLALLNTSASLDPERDVGALAHQSEHGWLAKFTFGYVVLHYDDVLALLRERSLHQASGLVTQLFTGEGTALDQLSRESLLSAEGDTHTRLRRLVARPFLLDQSIDSVPSCANTLVNSRDHWARIEPAGDVIWKDSRLAVWGAQSVPLRVTPA